MKLNELEAEIRKADFLSVEMSVERKCWIDNVKEWLSLPIPEQLTIEGLLQKRLEQNLC